MDYYDILCISKESTDDQIRKAYYKMALKWHPDKNKSDEAKHKFQEISIAYQVLSNANMRSDYDLYGTTPTAFKSPNELFSELFSGFDPKLNKFLTTTLSNITNSIIDDKNKNVWDIINNIDHNKIIEESGDVIKYLLKNSLSKIKQNIKQEQVYTLTLNYDSLDAENEINIPLDFSRKYTHIFLIINMDNDIKKYILDLEYEEHTITIDNKNYAFYFIDKLPNGYIRNRLYDLVIEYDINLKYKITGFFFDYPYTNENININITFNNNSNIVKISEKGLLHNNFYGDLYIIFKFSSDEKKEEILPKTGYPVYDTIDPFTLI